MTKEFKELGKNEEERIRRIWDNDKDTILRKFWIEKEKARKKVTEKKTKM